MTNEEDSIKEIGWRELPLFNLRSWVKAICIYLFLFVSIVVCFVPIHYAGNMTEQEKELFQKKQELEARLADQKQFEKKVSQNKDWFLSVLIALKRSQTPTLKSQLKHSDIEYRFTVNEKGIPEQITLIKSSGDIKIDQAAFQLIQFSSPLPTPVPERKEWRTVSVKLGNTLELIPDKLWSK